MCRFGRTWISYDLNDPPRALLSVIWRRLDGAHHFDGSMDEVRIYKRALTSTEINSIRTTNTTAVPNVVLDLPLG